jgi:hypothetical protein
MGCLVERLQHAGELGRIMSFERVNEHGARHFDRL